MKETNEIESVFADNFDHNLNDPIHRVFNPNEMSDILGSIVGETDKAFLIKFDEIEDWVPKSAIKSYSLDQKNTPQKFLIDNWILKKLHLIP